jgi:hypothetical protein
MIHDFLLIIAVLVLNDIRIWAAGRLYMWHRVRQTRKSVEAERLQSQREQDERIARVRRVIGVDGGIPFPDRFRGPLVIEAENDHQGLQALQELMANFRSIKKPILTTCGGDQ